MHVENLTTKPHSKDIRAFMAEIISVFKDISKLNRDQITNFSINQVAPNVIAEPDKLADIPATVFTGGVGELQDVLQSLVLLVMG